MSIICLIFLIFCLSFQKLGFAEIYLQPRDDLDVDAFKSNGFVYLLIRHNNRLRTKSMDIQAYNADGSSIPSLMKKQNDEKADELSMADLNLSSQQKKILRKRWTYSCEKKASKLCTKACKNTFKIVCDSYRCSKRMKKSFKRECKTNCKAKFVSSKTDTESE